MCIIYRKKFKKKVSRHNDSVARCLDNRDGNQKKSNFTLEKLHALAKERSLERKKRNIDRAGSTKKELETSKGIERLIVNGDTASSDEEVCPRSKRMKQTVMEPSKEMARLTVREDDIDSDGHDEPKKKKRRKLQLQVLQESNS